MGESVGMPRLNSKAGHCISDLPNSAQSFLHMLKNAGVDAELKISMKILQSLNIPGESKAPRTHS